MPLHQKDVAHYMAKAFSRFEFFEEKLKPRTPKNVQS